MVIRQPKTGGAKGLREIGFFLPAYTRPPLVATQQVFSPRSRAGLLITTIVHIPGRRHRTDIENSWSETMANLYDRRGGGGVLIPKMFRRTVADPSAQPPFADDSPPENDVRRGTINARGIHFSNQGGPTMDNRKTSDVVRFSLARRTRISVRYVRQKNRWAFVVVSILLRYEVSTREHVSNV